MSESFNLAYAILAIDEQYAALDPAFDFTILNDELGQRIVVWGNPLPQPTEEQIAAGWANYLAEAP